MEADDILREEAMKCAQLITVTEKGAIDVSFLIYMSMAPSLFTNLIVAFRRDIDVTT